MHLIRVTVLGAVLLALNLIVPQAAASEYASATSLGKPDGRIMGCPSGSFWDPRAGGECWSCGNKPRSVFPVDGPRACGVDGVTAFARATMTERNKTSCPDGSFYDIGKGSCWTCPAGTKRTAFAVDGGKACQKVTPRQNRKAKYVYTVDSLLKSCKKGTFANVGSRKCHTCPSGWKHDPSKSVGKSGVCFKPRKVHNYSAENVHNISLKCRNGFYDPINGGSCWTCPQGYVRQVSSVTSPKACMKVQKPTFAQATFVQKHAPNAREVARGVSQLGCANKGKNAFFDPKNGGSCWSCPSGNPVRSLHPVDSNKACMSRTCGKEGGRPCLVWERLPSCDAGLVEDFMHNECRKPTNLACTAYVSTVAALAKAVDKANETGEALSSEAIDKIPGAKLLLKEMSRKMQEVQELQQRAVSAMPVDEALAPMTRLLAQHQDKVRTVATLTEHAKRTKKELRDILLDPEVVCTGNTDRLEYKLEALGFKDLLIPPKRTTLNMAQAGASPFPFAAAQAVAPLQVASNSDGLFGHNRMTVDFSVTIPLEKLLSDPGVFKLPLTLGLQGATNFNGSTGLYFSHGLGAGGTARDKFKDANFLAAALGQTSLSVGFQYNGPNGSACIGDGNYSGGVAAKLTEWVTIGFRPLGDPWWSGFAVTLPGAKYGGTPPPPSPLTALTVTPVGQTPAAMVDARVENGFHVNWPELRSLGAGYDGSLKIAGNGCGPVN